MIEKLIEMSNKYGSKPEFVLAGGGNSSYKDNDVLVVKASGFKLANITREGFVKLNRKKLSKMWAKPYDKDTSIREKEILTDLMNARYEGENNRPSVETQLHELFPFHFILHLHPTKVNAVTCSKQGESWMRQHFSDTAVWIEETKPGYILAMKCKEKMDEFNRKNGAFPQILFLENHGVFFAADTTVEIDNLVEIVMNEIDKDIANDIDLTKTTVDEITYKNHLNAITSLDEEKCIVFEKNKAIDNILQDQELYEDVKVSFTPDHVVYCKHESLYASLDNLHDKYKNYTANNGFPPRIILLQGSGMFSIGDNKKQATNASLLYIDQIKIGYYSKYFGGPKPMSDEIIKFILNWEVEHYRLKVMNK